MKLRTLPDFNKNRALRRPTKIPVSLNIWVVLVATVILVGVRCGAGLAANFYVSQSGGSVSCGADGTQSTQSVAWFNTAGNWANPKVSGMIGPGDTVNLCGTFSVPYNSNYLNIQGSGSSGNPITIRWESNAELTSPAAQNFILTDGNSYLVFDGNGTNPSMTNTADGTDLTYQLNTGGISGSSCNYCEIKNLTMTNLFVHDPANDNSGGNQQLSVGVYLNGSNWSVHGCTFDQMSAGVMSPITSSGNTNNSVYNNTFNHFNWGVYYNPSGTSISTSNFSVYNNTFGNMAVWDSSADWYHHDGIFVVYTNGSGSITNTQIYNNIFNGTMSNCTPNSCATAWIYTNTSINGMYIFNNIAVNAGGSYIFEGGISGDQNYYIYNNTLDAGGGSTLNYSSVNGFVVENNIFMNLDSSPTYFNGLSNYTFDYNAYENYNSGETHSLDLTAAQLNLNSSYQPQSGSSVIGKGLNLTSTAASLGITSLDSDYAGNPRPSSAAWDIGAYSADSVVLNAPTNLTVTNSSQ